MHAIIGTFKMDRTKQAEQQVELHERIIPMVKALPGFVSGTWSYDPSTFRHSSHIVFETKDAAEKLAGYVKGDTARQTKGGVELESMEVFEVLGTASR